MPKPSPDFYPSLIQFSIHSLNMSSNLRFKEGNTEKHESVQQINPALYSCFKMENGGLWGWFDISYRRK